MAWSGSQRKVICWKSGAGTGHDQHSSTERCGNKADCRQPHFRGHVWSLAASPFPRQPRGLSTCESQPGKKLGVDRGLQRPLAGAAQPEPLAQAGTEPEGEAGLLQLMQPGQLFRLCPGPDLRFLHRVTQLAGEITASRGGRGRERAGGTAWGTPAGSETLHSC